MFGILLLQTLWRQYQQVEPIPYSQFQAYLKDGKIDDIVKYSEETAREIDTAMRRVEGVGWQSRRNRRPDG